MPLVSAKCTNCGANLEINTNDTIICPHCNTPYTIEKNPDTHNNTSNINANTVNIVNVYGSSNDVSLGNNIKSSTRNLTIKREKSFVGCAVKLKVYIEDATSNEITINNTPCRKLGTIKNGEEETFQIDNNEAKVFVIADKLTKDYCNDYYTVPAGDEDISISGKNHFNPSNGNAFLFNGASDVGVLQKRKSNKRKGIIIFLVCIAIGVVIGLLPSILSKPEAKTFTSDGMTITLTDEFAKEYFDGYTVCYTSKKAVVIALREGFYEYGGDASRYTLNEYGNLVLETNNLDSELKTSDGLTYFEYSRMSDGVKYAYFAVVYKADDAFWLVQFSTTQKNMDKLKPTFIEWANSVEF